MKRLVVIGFAGCALASLAMPTRSELTQAQEMVSDVTASDVKALKAGAKKPSEVAAAHMALAAKSDSEAEKYLLLQGAFRLYVKDGDYEHAAKAVETMQSAIKDFNPEVIVELCSKELIRKMKENAPRLYALKENARRIVFYRKQLPVREKAAKDKPADVLAQRKLGECHAELGDWPKALAAFAKSGGALAKKASAEASGTAKAQDLADFWWDYESKSDTPVYRLHAAEWYRKALSDNAFQGLARERANRRMKEVGVDYGVTITDQTKTSQTPQQNQVVCAESAGATVQSSEKPLSFELNKDVAMEFAHCPAGTVRLTSDDNGTEVKITRAYWMTPNLLPNKVATALGLSDGKDDDKAMTGRGMAQKVAQALTARHFAKLPNGYVFRLPTEAEFVNAVKTKSIPYERLKYELCLDTYPRLGKRVMGGVYDASLIKHNPTETDLVNVCEKDPVSMARFDIGKRNLYEYDNWVTFRLVVGPDLLSEKKK